MTSMDIYVDNSLLRSVATCSTQALLRHRYGMSTPDEAAPLRAGRAFHRAMEVFFGTRGVDQRGALAVFETDYRAWADANVPDDHRLAWPNLNRIIASWMATRMTTIPFDWPHPSLVEIGFAFPLVEGIVFVGRLDGLVNSASLDAWYILEHKSTFRITSEWTTNLRNDSQVSGYIWAATQHLGKPVVGAFINGVEFSKLPVSTRKCPKHAVPYVECADAHVNSDLFSVQRTPNALDEWKWSAVNLARGFVELSQRYPTIDTVGGAPVEGKFSGACGRCQFREFCAFGKPQSQVKAMLVYDPWNPLDHATAVRQPMPAKEEGSIHE